jgi:hypothetical protein
MPASNGNIDLEVDYGIDYTMGLSTIGTEFAVGTNAARVTLATAKYPWFIAYCTCDSARSGLGVANRVPTPGAPLWTDAQILQCSSFVAAHNDAIWKTGGGINGGWYFGALPLSRANIIWPHGSFYINYPLMLNFGGYSGQGPSQSAPDLNTPLSQVTYGTRLSIWHENWLDIEGADGGPRKHIMRSINFPLTKGGVLYAGVLGATGAQARTILDTYYMEGLQVTNVRLNGRKSMAPEAVGGGETYVTTYEDAGIAVWRPGSNSFPSVINGESFNNSPFQLCSGVPCNAFNLRGFYSNYAGCWLRGDGSFGIDGFECDECPTVYKAEGYPDPENPGQWLLPPGAKLTATNTKVETGTGGVGSFNKGTMLFDGIGWCTATFDGVSYAATNIAPELLCRVQPFPSTFPSTNSYVKVSGLTVFGFIRTLMHHADGTNSKKWFMDKWEYEDKYAASIHGFTYNSANGGSLTVDSGAAPPAISIDYTNRQAFLPLPLPPFGSRWDDSGTTGLPAYTNPLS